MKNKLIKLQDKFILVSDEEIKEGDECIARGNKCYNTTFKAEIVDLNVYNKTYGYFGKYEIKKIISENLDFSLLSEEECKNIGFVDVEKLADEFQNILIEDNWRWSPSQKIAFKEGFKTAQSLNDKMFSLEDMKSFAKFSIENNVCEEENRYYQYWELFKMWQSLQQTSWDCICELSEDKKSYIITKIII